MNQIDLSLRDFSAALASKAPSPGGGGASALCGALAAALGSMVGALTAGKKQYAANESALLALGEKAEQARLELLALIDGDEAAFAPLAAAYAMNRDDPARAETIERCLGLAAAAPARIAELCCEVIELLEGYAALGSRLLLSDAATGAALAKGALKGAYINTKVNTALMKDRKRAEEIDTHMEELLRSYSVRADAVCDAVAAALGF